MLCFPSHRSREDEELKKWLKAVAMGSRTGGVILDRLLSADYDFLAAEQLTRKRENGGGWT